MTANLLRGKADPDALADLVRRLEPDVVALQELGAAQASAVAGLVPFGLLLPDAPDRLGLAVRRPATVRRLPLPGRGALVTDLPLADGTDVEVINLHAIAPHTPPLWASIWSRRRQLRALLDHLDATARSRRVLLGDLNATPLWPFYRRLGGRFEDAASLAARTQGRRPERTWGPWPGAPRLLRIDHVLVTGLAVARCRVEALPGSDHAALVADLAVVA